MTKARWRNKEDPQLSEKDIIPGVFGPLVFDPFFVNELRTPFSRHHGRQMSNNIDNIVGVEYSDPKSESHLQHQQSTSLVKGSDNTAVNKSKPSRNRKAQAGTYKENETITLSRVIALEQELGLVPGLIELQDRFSREEIHAVWDELIWLYPGLREEEPAELVVA